MEKERKKSYTFRFDAHTNNTLTTLASKYHKDRTAFLEYIISVYGAMWLTPENEKKVLDERENSEA